MRRLIFLILLVSICSIQAQKSAELKQVTSLIQQKKIEQAQSLLTTILQENKDFAEAHYLLGVVYMMRGDYDHAIAELKDAIAINGTEYKYYERLGDAYGLKAQKGSIFSALFVIGDMRSNWEKAIELKPDIVSARERLFSYYLVAPGIAGGDMEKALSLANEVLKLQPARGHVLLARYHQKSKEPNKAEQEYLKAVAIDSSNGNLANSLGYFYLNEGKSQKAKFWPNRYIALQAENPNAYDSKGDCFVKTEEYDSALTMYEIALQKDPAFESSLFKRAGMLKKLNQTEQLKEAVQSYLTQYPEGRFADQAKALLKD